MAKLNSTGPISLGGSTSGQSVALSQFRSATSTISLNESDIRITAGKTTPGSTISMSNLYGSFKPFTVVAYGIGGGGGSGMDTTGGSGGGGAVVKQFTMSPQGVTSSLVVIGGGGYNTGGGGTSYLTNGQFTIYAYGGAGNPYGPPCGNCIGGSGVGGGGASGGDLNLTGGGGSGWNQCYIGNIPTYDGYGNYAGDVAGYIQYNGFDGQGARGYVGQTGFDATYYAAGGGGGGSDFAWTTSGGAGGYYAGAGGYGVHSGGGGGGNAYGGGSGGAGNYHGGTGAGAQGAFIIKYNSSTQLASGGSVSFNGTTWTHIFTGNDYFTAI